MTRRPFRPLPGPARSAGLTLVELMIAMVLGLVVIGGVLAIVLANSQSYRSSEALSEIQESTRTAFELLARDIRQAGETGCGNHFDTITNTHRVTSTLDTTTWSLVWNGIQGYSAGQTDPAGMQRVAGTDSIHLQSIEGNGFSVDKHEHNDATFTLLDDESNFNAGDILIVCDFNHATIFQASAYNPLGPTVSHEADGSPGNCSEGLGFPVDCTDETGNAYRFAQNSLIARLASTAWYIGNNGRPEDSGSSLYRIRLSNQGGAPTHITEEIVAGITNMQLRYRVGDAATFSAASALSTAQWRDVNAIEITLSTDSAAQTQDGRLSREFTSIVSLRNRTR